MQRGLLLCIAMFLAVVGLALLSGGADTAQAGHGCHGCSGCHGCYGCHGCQGCYGCHGCCGGRVVPGKDGGVKPPPPPVPKKADAQPLGFRTVSFQR